MSLTWEVSDEFVALFGLKSNKTHPKCMGRRLCCGRTACVCNVLYGFRPKLSSCMLGTQRSI